MANEWRRAIRLTPSGGKVVGLEHLLLAERVADSVVLAVDEEHGPFRVKHRASCWRVGRTNL